MKRHLLRALLVVLLVVARAEAANFTLTYTTAQDTQIQTRLIPLYNKAHCAKFGLGASCTSAQLVTAGCVAVVFKTVTIDSCTIFTQDATGEGLFLQEIANQQLADIFSQLVSSDNVDFCTSWKTLTTTQQNTQCTTQGLPNGCSPCP